MGAIDRQAAANPLLRYHWHLRAITYHKKTTSKQRWSLINLVLLFFCLFGKKSRSIDHFHSILLLYLSLLRLMQRREEYRYRCPPTAAVVTYCFASSITHHLAAHLFFIISSLIRRSKKERKKKSTDYRPTQEEQDDDNVPRLVYINPPSSI